MFLEFIEQHKILAIGSVLPGELFAEIILDAPYEFIDVALDNNYFISKISWWERAKIRTGSMIGFGGPRDPRVPEEYFFSETGICREFGATTTTDEYYSYINNTQAEYKKLCLIPSFELQYKGQVDGSLVPLE